MALKHPGETVDFHVGSVESLFPHDENENALFTAATGKPMANAWLHCERVLKDGRPLKEAGLVTVRDLMAQGYRGEEVRYFLLATHYRKPLAVSDTNLKAAAVARARLDHFLERLALVTGEAPVTPAIEERLFLLKKEATAALDDDLNIARFLSACFAAVGEFHSDIDHGRLGQAGAAAILARFQELDEVLGVMNPVPAAAARDEEIEARLAAREEARKRRDWETADKIRDELAARGIEITDTPGGPRWRRR
jgi:cysteinyl-tRNA synthetase